MPISEATLRTDIVMTAVPQCVFDGDAAATLVLTKMPCRSQLDHSIALELAASSSVQNGRCSRKQRGSASIMKPQLPVLRRFDHDCLSDGSPA
jgi:hypothetical protein